VWTQKSAVQKASVDVNISMKNPFRAKHINDIMLTEDLVTLENRQILCLSKGKCTNYR
jgi:hypothetical protein